jgi:Predicted restriction endonuclease
MRKSKLVKDKCEIESCNVTDSNLLHLHHIIERTEINTNNSNFNLAILCANCHALTHSGRLKIIGVYPSTKLPNKRVLIYELDGKKNIDGIDTPYVEFKNKSFKIGNQDE